MIEPQQSYEEPREYTPTNVIYWEDTSKELRREGRFGTSLLNKSRKFLQNNCIKQISDASWTCDPIKDYNKTSHYIISTTRGLTCDCQGFKKKQKDFDEGNSNIKPICSHIVAVKQYCFLEEKNE